MHFGITASPGVDCGIAVGPEQGHEHGKPQHTSRQLARAAGADPDRLRCPTHRAKSSRPIVNTLRHGLVAK